MGYARIWVTNELLREALHLPFDAEIHFAGNADQWRTTELIVSHRNLPDIVLSETEQPPLVTPTFRKQEPVVFVDWGIAGHETPPQEKK